MGYTSGARSCHMKHLALAHGLLRTNVHVVVKKAQRLGSVLPMCCSLCKKLLILCDSLLW